MVRVAISVEGPTEFEFVQRILAPYFLNNHNISLTSIPLHGNVSLARVESELKKLIPKYDYVTTFYDLYGFIGVGNITADKLELKLAQLFNSRKFIPYIQKYEFETLLFSEASYYSEYFDNPKAEIEMQNIINSFYGNIEDINNSPQTAPSKRIIKFFDNYDETFDKVFFGYSIIEDIGLKKVLEKAPRFRAWIEKIENLTK